MSTSPSATGPQGREKHRVHSDPGRLVRNALPFLGMWLEGVSADALTWCTLKACGRRAKSVCQHNRGSHCPSAGRPYGLADDMLYARTP